MKATFFMVGQNIVAHPDIVANVLREGHSVAGHTWTHPQMNKISLPQAEKEIDTAAVALAKVSQEV